MHQVVLLDHDAPVGPDDGSRGTDKAKVTHGVHSTDIDMFCEFFDAIAYYEVRNDYFCLPW